MSNPRLEALVNELLQSTRNTNSVLVCVGAGASVSAGVPSWSQFVRYLYDSFQHVFPEADRQEYKEFVERATPAETAELLRTIVGVDVFEDKLREVLSSKSIKPTDLHDALSKLPANAIVTTNYDSLIESALQNANRRFTTIITGQDLLPMEDEGLKLFKLHGSLERPSTLELPGETYYGPIDETLTSDSALRALFSISLVIFIGYNVDSHDFKEIYSLYKGETQQANWVVIAPQFNSITAELWRNRDVRLISVAIEDQPTLLRLLARKLESKTEVRVTKQERNRILVTSSSESLSIAYKLQEALTPYSEVILWNEIFSPGLSFLESLEHALGTLSGVIVILSSDDVISSRHALNANLMFELGYLTATLGRERVIVVLNRESKIPTDLAGLSHVVFDDKNLELLTSTIRRWVNRIGGSQQT